MLEGRELLIDLLQQVDILDGICLLFNPLAGSPLRGPFFENVSWTCSRD